MDPLTWWLSGIGAAALVGAGVAWHRSSVLGRVARRLGLKRVSSTAIAGTVSAYAVHLELGRRARLTINGLPASLTIHAKGAAPQTGMPQLVTGDAAFDAQVRVTCDAAKGFALLDADTRDQLATAIVTGFELSNGVLRWSGDANLSASNLRRVVRTGIATALRLGRQADVAALAEIVVHDSLAVARCAMTALPPGARRDALDTIVMRKAQDERALIAAERLGTDAVERLALDVGQAVQVRGAALRWLKTHAADRAADTARACLDVPEMTRIALEIIGDTVPIALNALGDLARHDRAAIVRVLNLAERHGADAEALLLDWLGDVDPVNAQTAAECLGRVGTITAIPALRLRARFHLSSPPVRTAANAAIDAIHSRLAPPGGLSMPDESSGQVSFAPLTTPKQSMIAGSE